MIIITNHYHHKAVVTIIVETGKTVMNKEKNKKRRQIERHVKKKWQNTVFLRIRSLGTYCDCSSNCEKHYTTAWAVWKGSVPSTYTVCSI